MFTHLITLVLGFAAGCTVWELIKSKSHKPINRYNNPTVNRPSSEVIHNVESTHTSHAEEFSLQSLQSIFSFYGVSMLNAGSFGILLRKIRTTSYKDILKLFLDEAATPELLTNMLKTKVIPDKDFSFAETGGAPYIQTEKIEAYIKEEGVPMSEFSCNKDKIGFLLSLYYAKGIDDFKNTLGTYMSDIIKANENGDDISILYSDIMSLVKSRYSFLT